MSENTNAEPPVDTGHPLPMLVAIGDSDDHDAALDHAAAQAVREGRDLVLVHVIHPVTGPYGFSPEATMFAIEAAEEAGTELLAKAADRARHLVDGQVGVRTRMVHGETVEVLVMLGAGAHRIVLQHRGLSRLERIFTGSVSAGVAGRANVPVVSVPESWTPRRAGSQRRLTVCVAGGPGDEPLLEHAFAEASASDATLAVLHAWYLPSAYDESTFEGTATRPWPETAEEAIERRLTQLRGVHPDVHPRIEVSHLHPSDAIVEASRDSDLVIVGRSRTPRRLPHLGSLTRTLIRESLCPVEVVPSGASEEESGEVAGP